MGMAPWRRTGRQGDPAVPVQAPEGMVQIQLEELGMHSWTQALLGAVIGSGGGPHFRFVAAPADADDEAPEQAAAGERFPVVAFKDLADVAGPDEWSALARRRLDELDAELVALGWRGRPDRGRYWWSLRYDAPEGRRAG